MQGEEVRGGKRILREGRVKQCLQYSCYLVCVVLGVPREVLWAVAAPSSIHVVDAVIMMQRGRVHVVLLMCVMMDVVVVHKRR